MKATNAGKSLIIRKLLKKWSVEHPRPMPWRNIKDPYKIWLSEIILQQTRVQQGWPYYERFVRRYPTIHDLSDAPIDEVLKQWEGLGYYQRARNMHAAAKQVVLEYNGVFPATYDQIRSLKGVGDYTAAAIASFAYDLPHAVVDGNVIRVICRIFGIKDMVSSISVRKRIEARAQEVLDTGTPGEHNQAIMDFGAMQCIPKHPDCEKCPMINQCTSFQLGITQEIPLKKKTKSKRSRYFFYLIFQSGDRIFIRKRKEKDIWQGLYEFFLVERPEAVTWKEIQSQLSIPYDIVSDSAEYQQVLSHQKIFARFARAKADEDWLVKNGYTGINRKKMRNFAFPKIVDCYLRDKGLNLI